MPTNVSTGLSSEEAKRAPKNSAPHHTTSLELAWRIGKAQVISFFFILLVISGALSLFLGEKADSGIFFTIAVINAILGFIQEFRANRSTQLLERMIHHVVTVRRDSKILKIPHFDVVLGDIVILDSGDIVVVDARVINATDAFLDESVVTGESIPRLAKPGDIINSGVTISSGTIEAEVTAVGKANSLSQYAEKITKIDKNSNFEEFIHTVSKTVVIITVICLLVVLTVNVLISHGMTFPDFILFGISMLIGVVPESLPLIITLILSHEALELSKQQVLIKRLSVLQNLGGMDNLFTDKTGTITQNFLQVKVLIKKDPAIDEVLSMIANGNYKRTPMDEVFDAALVKYFDRLSVIKQESAELGFDPYKAARGYAVHTLADGSIILRGQYDAVIDACKDTPGNVREECKQYELGGLRVIAIAKKESETADAKFLGAILFEDPLKPDAITIYKELCEIGIKVKIITGDSMEVAQYIGKVLHPGKMAKFAFDMTTVKDEHDTDQLSDYFIYAKSKPEQKSLLIDAHEKHGVVGFMGEGINDAIALKRADIGFVVSNGSDVARQAGDVILLEKSLEPVITAVMMSRQAFIKIRTYLLCTLTGNLGTLFSLTIIVLISQQLPLLPIQILLNNLLTDLPLMFLISDHISKSSMRKPIKDETRKFFHIIVIFAALSSVFDFLYFFLFKHYDITVLRTGWFVFSVLAELTLVLSLRSELSIFKAPRISKMLSIALLICFGIAIILPYLSIGKIFSLVPLTLTQVIWLAAITIVYFCANELTKKILSKK